MAYPQYKFIISRTGDSVFALAVGLGAATTRILREERQKGYTTNDIVQIAKRRFYHLFPPAGED